MRKLILTVVMTLTLACSALAADIKPVVAEKPVVSAIEKPVVVKKAKKAKKVKKPAFKNATTAKAVKAAKK